MSSFRIRPRFVHRVAESPSIVRRQLIEALAAHAATLELRPFHDFIGLHIGERERRHWSPRLFLHLQPAPEGGTLIEGVYGPEVEVWGVFVYGYLITGLLSVFATIFGSAQLFVGHWPWGFWVVGGMAAVAGGLYLAAQMGQKLGAWQTFQLHQAYESAIGARTEIH